MIIIIDYYSIYSMNIPTKSGQYNKYDVMRI